MGHLLTTFFWSTSSFTGSAQLNEGAFFIGNVNKLFRAEVRGLINYQGVVLASTGVNANFPAWGLQQIPHGNAAQDVITSGDNDSWLCRQQTGLGDTNSSWAPSSSNGANLVTNAIQGEWAGQLAIGANTDVFLSIKSSTGASLSNLNTFGTIRLWWA